MSLGTHEPRQQRRWYKRQEHQFALAVNARVTALIYLIYRSFDVHDIEEAAVAIEALKVVEKNPC